LKIVARPHYFKPKLACGYIFPLIFIYKITLGVELKLAVVLLEHLEEKLWPWQIKYSPVLVTLRSLSFFNLALSVFAMKRKLGKNLLAF
jgi:uncharacterized membrane protein